MAIQLKQQTGTATKATRPKAPPAAAVKAVNGLVSALENAQNKLLPPPVVLLNMTAGGLLISRGIYIAAELGLADLLIEGPRSTEELAAATGVDADALYRILRALASVGIFAECADGRFELTKLASYLRSDIAGSMRGWARYIGADWHWSLWAALPDSVRNGKSTYENVHGVRFFEWFTQHPAPGQIFDAAMTSVSEMANPAIVAAYDWSGIDTLVDVAGGQGSLLASILQTNPRIQGTLFDLPQVIANSQATGLMDQDGLAGRCELFAGDFFESVPPGRDAYLLKWILHDWSDAEALQILNVCRRAMEPGKKLLVAEMVIEPGNDPFFGKLLDIAMLALTGGRERTTAEYRALFEAAGFKLQRVVPTASPYSIIEGLAVM